MISIDIVLFLCRASVLTGYDVYWHNVDLSIAVIPALINQSPTYSSQYEVNVSAIYFKLKVVGVVVTLSFNAKMVMANFECNLND